MYMGSQLFPLCFADACLTQDFGQEIPANVSAMGIRYSNVALVVLHELMTASRERAAETEPP
jgi:hypothetical protein